MYFIIGIIDIIILIITSYKIYTLFRNPIYSEHPGFNFEKEWFWICLKFTTITTIACFMQFLALMFGFNLFLYIIADTTLLLSTITITIIALGRKAVRDTAFGEYTGINNENVEKLEEKIKNKTVKV
jgi:uncharacterized membrane protein